jgi:hypothetical protein
MKRVWTEDERNAAREQFYRAQSFNADGSICYTDALDLACQRNVLRDALIFVQEKCQLYGAADAARERIESALAQTEGSHEIP